MAALGITLQDTPAGPAATLKIQLNFTLETIINWSCDVQEELVIPAKTFNGWGFIPIVGDVGQIIQDLDP